MEKELKANRIEMMIIVTACEQISPEALEAEIDAFFYDYLDDTPYIDSVIDLSILSEAHAEAFFGGFSTASEYRGVRFGFPPFDLLSDYTRKLIPVDHSPLNRFSRHLLAQIPMEGLLDDELRDLKAAAEQIVCQATNDRIGSSLGTGWTGYNVHCEGQ